MTTRALGAEGPRGFGAALRAYGQLAKPGIILGNLITTVGGYVLGSGTAVDGRTLIATLLGVALVIAGGCAFNNVIDRDIDARMKRTRRRVMVVGAVTPEAALIYGSVLGLAGLIELAVVSGPWPAALAGFGFFVYVVVYSLFLKRWGMAGILVGSLAGAAPPVIGYCAASGRFDLGAVLLLAIFSLWQIPHSHAIGILHAEDYGAAGVPVQAVKAGSASAKRHIVVSVSMFTLLALSLTVAGYTGYVYGVVAATAGVYWLAVSLRPGNDRRWAKRVFTLSILAVMAISAGMALDRVTVTVDGGARVPDSASN